MDFLDNTSMPSLQHALNGLSERQRAISANISNVSVPGYKSKQVLFEETLQQVIDHKRQAEISLESTDDDHMNVGAINFDEAEIETRINDATELHSGGNNVDVDSEMVNLAKTGLQYRAITQMARKQVDGLRAAIRGGL